MTSYTRVFGGQTISPAQLWYTTLDLTANVTLQWPVEIAPAGADLFSDVLDATSDQAGRQIIFPDATEGPNGAEILINNLGAFTISVRDDGGTEIGAVPSGEVWYFYLADNSTSDGVWRAFQFGTGTSSASAASLAGAGLKAIVNTLNLKILPQDVAATPHSVMEADRAQALRWTGGIGEFDLPNPATVGADWFVWIKNAGTGTLTLDPAGGGTIDTGSLAAGASIVVVSDGTNWFTMAESIGDAGNFDYISIAVGGGAGTTVLAGSQLNRVAYKFTGVLTGARIIEVPNTIQQYWVNNATTGAFALTVKTAAGTGVIVPTGTSRILYCDGVNVVQAQIGNLMCSATTSGTAVLPDNTFTDVSFATDLIDIGDWHTAPSVTFTVPPGVTAVEISAMALLSVVAAETMLDCRIRIRHNGSAFVFPQLVVPGLAATASIITVTSAPLLVACAAGDTFVLQAYIHTTPGAVGGEVVTAWLTVKAVR